MPSRNERTILTAMRLTGKEGGNRTIVSERLWVGLIFRARTGDDDDVGPVNVVIIFIDEHVIVRKLLGYWHVSVIPVPSLQ
jgi:hypothetical protein